MRILGFVIYFGICIAAIIATIIWGQYFGTGFFAGAAVYGVYAVVRLLSGIAGVRGVGDRIEIFAGLYPATWYDWVILLVCLLAGGLIGGLAF